MPKPDIEAISALETSSTEKFPLATPSSSTEERTLLRKIDIRLLPPLFTLFLLAFLDRTNIGNARIQGLEPDLHMSGPDYNIALFIFFIPYILFEVPSNLILKKLSPSTWLSLIMILWGIATIGQGLVHTFGGLVAMRVLVGLFEAGLFPGCVYLISMYYPRYSLQVRLSLFFSASILAGAFGGLLAFAIAHMRDVAGYNGWRWIFIIEGLVTVVVGALAKFWVVDWPETASFLSAADKTLLKQMLARDTGEAKMDRLDKPAVKRIFKDWKIYTGVAMYFGIVNTGYAGSFFIPTIINELGYTAEIAQVRSIPIFIVATFTSLLSAYFSDRVQRRYVFCLLGLLISAIGYIILLAQDGLSTGVKYFALFLIVPGGYITQPVVLAWVQNNMAGHYKRSVSAAMTVGFGNLGGIVASNVFLVRERPKYPTGYGVSLGLLGVCAVACTVLWVGVQRENTKRERGERDWRLDSEKSDNLGDDHPSYRFTT